MKPKLPAIGFFQDSADDIIEIRVPVDVYFRRPAKAGPRIRGAMASPLTRLFLKNLGVFNRQAFADKEMEVSHQPSVIPVASFQSPVSAVGECHRGLVEEFP